MADAPKLTTEDLLYEGVPKINAAIDNANQALKNSDTATVTASEAVGSANEAMGKSNQAIENANEALNRSNAATLTSNEAIGNANESLGKSNIALDKASSVQKQFLDSTYPILHKVIDGDSTADLEGVLKFYYCKNESLKDIDTIFVNNKIVVSKILPEEYIENGMKFSCYERYNLQDLDFNNLFIKEFGVDTARVHIERKGSYRTDVNKYNVISESNKFLAEMQLNFNDNPNSYIGYHDSAKAIEFKVLKVDVIGAGFAWDSNGIKSYMKSLPDFNFYIRLSNGTSIPYNVEPIYVTQGSNIVVSRLNTTILGLNYFVKEESKNQLNYNDIYSYTKYETTIKNTIGINYINKQIKIYASFKQGECLNENCIVVKDSTGKVVPHQWEDDRFVNFKYDKNMGRYSDGSLKDGYIWIIDNVLANEVKKYTVLVFKVEVSNLPVSVQHNKTSNEITFISDICSLKFAKTNKFLMNEILVNGITHGYYQDPSYKPTLDSTKTVRSDVNISPSSYEIHGSGVIFKEFIVTLSYADFFDIILKTRIYKNGIMQINQFFKATRDILKTECYGVFNRLNITTKNDFNTVTDKVLKVSWKDGTIKTLHVTYSHGDVPRDDLTRPTYPVMGVILAYPTDKLFRVISGWQYGTNGTTFDIPNGEVFSSGMEINWAGINDTNDTFENETDRVFNGLVGRITNQTKFKIKSDILKLITDSIYNIGTDYDDKKEGSSFSAFYPSFLGRIALWKMLSISTLEKISADYKVLINKDYESGDTEALWSKYKAGTLPLQFTSRIFPVAWYLIREFKKLGNQNEVTYYTNLIKAYAEMVCRSFEELGYVGLYYGRGYNSNATGAAMRALAQGIVLDPSNTRWKNAYSGLIPKFKEHIPLKNAVLDSVGQNLSMSHYIHYASYAIFEYVKSIELMNVQPLLDAISYPFGATSAYGAVKEQEYCISSSRRGAGHTNAYIIYTLIKEDSISSLAQARKMLERSSEQNKPEGGQEFPLESWKQDSQQYEGVIPFELQVLAECMYLLLDQNIRTNY